MKLRLIYLTLCSLSHAAYINRMAVSRIASHRPTPSAFRPGVVMRPWRGPGVVHAASHRAPYVIYRNVPQRYAVKHYTRGAHTGVPAAPGGPWKVSQRVPLTPSEYEFVRAASAPPAHTDGGAIHTIPAPNLSLSEKPIVVIEAEDVRSISTTSHSPKITYEVTEKYPDPSVYKMAKIEQPIGFSKATSLTSPEFQTLVRNGAALQLATDLGISAIALPQHSVLQQHIAPQQVVQQQQQIPQQLVPQQFIPQQQFLPQQQSIVPQQFTLQGFNTLNPQELFHAAPEGIVVSPNALYQPDPAFMQKLTNHLLQRFPGVEFIPYATDVQPHQSRVATPQPKIQFETETPQPQLFLLQNEQITKQTPSSFVTSESQNHLNVVQRETEEGTVVTLVPQELIVTNVTEKQIELTTASQPQNVTVEFVAAESQPDTNTVKYVVETSTQSDEQKTTPIYYAQVGQSIGNVIAKGFYSAINDVRAAAALTQSEKPQESNSTQENITTTTINPELKAYFVQKPETDEKNQTVTELKPVLGVPFAKTTDSVNVAYTLHRAEDKEPKVTKDGSVYAGQIVQATITEDHDFNKEKATILSRRAPIRLFAVTEKKATASTTYAPQRVTVVKAKIPPKSKLTFDDKTGEPVLRIYASYVDNPVQKELVTAKLSNSKQVKEVSRKQDTVDNWKSAALKAIDKTQGFDGNQVTQFGLKLRSRSDDYIPLFEDYEE